MSTLVLALACGLPDGGDQMLQMAPPLEPVVASQEDFGEGAGARGPAPAPRPAMEPAERKAGKAGARAAAAKASANAEAPPDEVRDWFPDAFLWQPAVATDDDGVASLEVRVPDTLTSWRVLGLAHDRSGQQAGALATFASRLPVYVEPAVPAYLHTGDVLELPVRAANGTTSSVSAAVRVGAEGALSGGGGADAVLAPGGVVRRTTKLRAERSGEARVRASVAGGGSRDEVVRTLRVSPTGTPVESETTGTLAGELALALPKPAAGRDEELEVTVWPGSLAVLLSEVERVGAGGRTALPGYGLALAAEVEAAGARAGVEADPAVLRKLRLLAFQAVVRSLGTSDPRVAADVLMAGGRDEAVGGYAAARAGLVAKVAQAQRPDGTWSSADRATLQRVLVETAHAASRLPAEATARVRAEGAIERHAPAATDPYTAAVLLGSGLVADPVAEPLREVVRKGLVRDDAGGVSVEVPADVVNAWGEVPSRTEMSAWTVLALPADDPDRGRLAADLVGRWRPAGGFGAGRADLVALQAVLAAVPGVAAPATVKLAVDGAVVAEARLDPADPKTPAVLRAVPGEAATLTLDPPGAGVLFGAVRRAWVPIDPEATVPGVDVVPEAGELQAGVEGRLTLTLNAPRGMRLTVDQGLPAGAVVDEDALRRDAGLASFEVLPDRVRLQTRPFEGLPRTVSIPVTPAFGGSFTTSPLAVAVDGRSAVALAPMRWEVRP